ncbi:ATP-dependent DNA helicase UvrD/PcrA, partial [Tremellales sp. Uapishka_1]
MLDLEFVILTSSTTALCFGPQRPPFTFATYAPEHRLAGEDLISHSTGSTELVGGQHVAHRGITKWSKHISISDLAESCSTGGQVAELSARNDQYLTIVRFLPLNCLDCRAHILLEGKTRVLTSRVAYLVQHHKYKPYEITAVTFTNKAAAEMKKRLQVLLGAKDADMLILGTFHATCAKYLRRHAKTIDLPNNFSITDADDCKKIIHGLIKAKAPLLQERNMALKDGAVLSEISKAKAREESPSGMAIRAANDVNSHTSTLVVIAELYGEYEEALREANSLDFDDLLVFGLKLFRTAPGILAGCKHILVDEFQDTNTTQYELMKCFAKAHGGVSVVGDPDQSIYGWRSAGAFSFRLIWVELNLNDLEVENLNKMTNDFPGVQAIHLEENYRSTGAILSASLSIVTQDRQRIPKSLFTAHPNSTAVPLKLFSTPVIEASFIAMEIKRLIAYSGGVLNHDDFAVLLRTNALSRNIETALQKESIPNRIIGGHKFFERLEVKDLLAYLQLADNPEFTPAFMRVVNVPRRSIGDKSLAELVAAAKKMKVSPMELSERITDGDKLPTGLKPAIKKSLASFVGIVRKLRRAAVKNTEVADLIKLILDKTSYEDHLRKTQPDFDQRWENVQELISHSVNVAQDIIREKEGKVETDGFNLASSDFVYDMIEKEESKLRVPLHHLFRKNSDESASRSRSTSAPREVTVHYPQPKLKKEIIEFVDSDDEIESVQPIKRERAVKAEMRGTMEDEMAESDGEITPGDRTDDATPLRAFLERSMLATDTEEKKDDVPIPKVTMTTVHSAKGLEWPVVFIPAVEQGTYPSYRCTEEHEIAEERRLLYVAMTRAQSFLTLSYCHSRMMGAEDSNKELSEFISRSQRLNPVRPALRIVIGLHVDHSTQGIFSVDIPEVDVNVRREIAAILGRTLPDEADTKDMIMKHVRAAPPLSMWDAPEGRDLHNRFARRENTKAARAAEYWSSDFDEYALPDTSTGATSSNRPFKPPKTGFVSARTAITSQSKPSSPARPPPPPIKSANRDFPAPLPFTFGLNEAPKAEAGIGLFTNSSSSSLAMMKNLGLPASTSSPASSPNPNTSPALPGVSSFQSTSSNSISSWKNLGPAETTQPLVKGTKRLGMGRPAPWGAKKARGE